MTNGNQQNQAIDPNRVAFNYRPIAEEAYDRDRFVESRQDLGELEESVEFLKDNPSDTKKREKVSGLLFGDRTFHVGIPPEQMSVLTKRALDDGQNSMAKYVKRNLDDMLGILKDEEMFGLVMSDGFHVYRTDNPKHNELADIVNEYKAMGRIMQKDDVGNMQKYIKEQIKRAKDIPEWVKSVVSYFASEIGFTKKIFQRYMLAKDAQLSQLVTNGESINRGRLENLVRDAIKLAEDEYESETDEGKHGDIWNDDLKGNYLEISRFAYSKPKQEFDKDYVPSDVRDRESKRMQGYRMAA